MKVVAVKITQDKSSFKVAYEKNHKVYVRDGGHYFKIGKQAHDGYNSLWKWGFRKVENPPTFRDAQDIQDNYEAFQMKADGSITYVN